MLKERFYKNLKIWKFTRICKENQINCDWVARVAIATFGMYNLKLTGTLLLILFLSSLSSC